MEILTNRIRTNVKKCVGKLKKGEKRNWITCQFCQDQRKCNSYNVYSNTRGNRMIAK